MSDQQANYYPPSLDLDVALGLAPHTDFNTLTILQQSDHVWDLQVIKDRAWVTVDPISGSFVVNVGDQLQVLCNGRYKSVHHKHKLRVSMAMIFGPDEETRVAPVEELVSEETPQVYRSYVYKEFLQEFHSKTAQGGDSRKHLNYSVDLCNRVSLLIEPS